MDQYGRQKRFGVRGRGTSDNTRVGGAQQSDPSYFELRSEGVIYETFAHMGNDCHESCEDHYFPQMSACLSASGTTTPCPGYCSGYAVCGGWVQVDDGPQHCDIYTYYCNAGSVGDAFTNCVQGCPPGGAYIGEIGRYGGTGRYRRGGRVRRRR